MSELFNFPSILGEYAVIELDNCRQIELAEYLMKNVMNGTAVSPPLKHFVCNGTYARQIELPAGMTLTGKVHNFDHTSILSKGSVTIMTAEGIERRTAPDIWISKAGTKRLIHVHEDTIWTTLHASKNTEVADLEAELVHDSDLSWIKESGLLEAIQ